MLAPYRVPPNGELSPDKIYVNSIIAHYRARVEHINHLFEQHGIFRGTFRGGVALMTDALYVIAHTTNIVLRSNPRYPEYGTWSHTTTPPENFFL